MSDLVDWDRELRLGMERAKTPVCGIDLGDPPDYCPCLLPSNHTGLHRCKHFMLNREGETDEQLEIGDE